MQGSFWWMSQESWYQGQRFKPDSLRGLFLGNQRAFEYRTTNKKCTELVLFEIPVNQLMNAYGIPIKCLIFCSDNQDSQGTGSLEWIYTIKRDAVHWLTDVNWVSHSVAFCTLERLRNWMPSRPWDRVPQLSQSGTKGLKVFWRIPDLQSMLEATETLVQYNGGFQLKQR